MDVPRIKWKRTFTLWYDDKHMKSLGPSVKGKSCIACSSPRASKLVMHDSDSGIGTDSGMIPFFAGIGIGIGIKKTELYWNRNRNRNGIKEFLLESESEPESEILKMLESE